MALKGLSGLAGFGTQTPYGEEGRDPKEWGTNPDTRHGVPGDASAASHELYQGTRYGPVVDQDEDTDSTPPAGYVLDSTPDTHAAPYPRGIQHDLVVAAEQMRELHGVDLGGPSRVHNVALPYPVDVEGGYTDSPNFSALAGGVPGQLRTGHDIDQGRGWDPGYGFAFGKLLRRVFHDPVPLDRTGTVRGERVFWGKHPVGDARFDGEDSPYGESGDTSRGMSLGPGPTGYATPYEQPANPTMSATTDYPGEAGFAGSWVL